VAQTEIQYDDFDLSPENLSDLIGVVYDSALEECQWQTLINKLADLFPHCCIVIMGFNGQVSHAPYAYSGMTSQQFQRIAATVQHGNDIVANRYQEISDLPLGFITRSRVVYTDQELEDTNMYRSFFGPLGCRHFFNLKFATFGLRNATIGFTLKPGEDAHHLSLFYVLKLIAPHIVRGMQISRAIKLARESSDRLTRLLNSIALPLIVVNAGAQILFTNAAGHRMLESGEIFETDGLGRLNLIDNNEVLGFRQHFAAMQEDDRPGGMYLNRNGAPVSICLLPIKSERIVTNQIDHDLISEERSYAVVLGYGPGGQTSVDLLKTVFDLTVREAEVCRSLLLGMSPQEIASKSGRSIKTVRNQVQAVLEKVGVNSTVSLLEALVAFRAVGDGQLR